MIKSSDLKTMIEDSRDVVFFTGAGISTESGIPDFRSPGGIWTKMAPIQFQDFLNSEEMRREYWHRKFATDKTLRIAKPNEGHYAIERLISSGKASVVITQNIDNLHQDSGVPEEKVIELHGNGTFASCLTCGTRYELDNIKQSFLGNHQLPICKFCGGLIKTATISFGQAMPLEPVRQAESAASDCDLFICIGSSLVVHPAAQIPLIAKDNRATLVILNRETTALDEYADLIINDEIGKILSAVITP
tara:strand:- start:187 stop:930 length:744 start_codon:yes stop_codon:yes gene_type:complete